MLEPQSKALRVLKGSELHGKSGRVALPRAKEGIVAGRAILEMVVKLGMPLRTVVEERRRAVDMLS